MKDPGVRDELLRNVLRRKHLIRAGVPAEGKAAVSVPGGLHKGQRCVMIRVHRQLLHADARILAGLSERSPKGVLPHLAKEGGFPSQLLEHRQNIAGRAPRVGLKQGITLGAHTAFRKINQQLAQGDHVKSHLICTPRRIGVHISPRPSAPRPLSQS